MKKSLYYLELLLNLNERVGFSIRLLVSQKIRLGNASAIQIILQSGSLPTLFGRARIWQCFCGKPGNNPYNGLFENFKPYEESMQLPTLESVKDEWKKASQLLKEAFALVSEEQLASDAPFKNPTGDFTIGGSIAFLAQHESYDIGQIGFLKKLLTNEAMSYN